MSTLDQAMDYLADEHTQETGTPSITMTTGSTFSASYIKRGRMVCLNITASRSANTAAGSNMFQGTINNTGLRPTTYAQTVSFNGSVGVIGQITAGGLITFRVITGTMASGYTISLTFLYMVA